MDTVKIDMFLGQSEGIGQIDGELQIPGEKGDIEKVFHIDCNVNVREINVGKDNIHLCGDAEFAVYYINKMGGLESFAADAPFEFDIEAGGIQPENQIKLLCRIDELGSSIIDQRNLRVTATPHFWADITTESGLPEINTEDMQTRTVEVDGRCLEKKVTHSFHINEEIRIPGGMEQVEAVIGTKCYGVINGVKKDGQNAICYGDICFNTIYSSKEGLWQINDSFPFEEVIDCDISLDDKEICPNISVRKATGTAYDPDVISYGVSAVIKLDIMSAPSCAMVVDTYSLSHEVDTTEKHISIKTPISYDNVKYTMRTIAKTSAIAKPLCIMAVPHVKSEYAMDGTVSIEGALVCNIVYEKEGGGIDCVKIKVPIDEAIPVSSIKEEYQVWTDPKVQKVTAIITGEDIELRCLMDIGVYADHQEEYDIIDSIEEKEPLNRESSSIMIYFRDEDEDIFDIAKKHHIGLRDINADNDNKLILINPLI